jgi:hypothetical protein
MVASQLPGNLETVQVRKPDVKEKDERSATPGGG